MNKVFTMNIAGDSAHACGAARRGFSLIEILVSILILALGLLGLGAVFPVVIREQRQATDNVLGTIAGNNVRATVRASYQDSAKVVYRTVSDTQFEADYYGLAALLAGGYEPLNNPDTGAPIRYSPGSYVGFSLGTKHGLWEPDWSWRTGNQLGSAVPGMEPTALNFGIIGLPVGTPGTNGTQLFDALPDVKAWELPVTLVPTSGTRQANGLPTGSQGKRRILGFFPITLQERLNPGAASTDETPTLVWDFVARRVPRGQFDKDAGIVRPSINDDLQLAVFVRRVDPGIRVQPGDSLRQAMLGARAQPTLLPVGRDAEGRPTFDGTDGQGSVRYSWPVEVQARDEQGGSRNNTVFDFYDVDNASTTQENVTELSSWLQNVDVSTPEGEAMAQVGQKLVDNLGNVYTVDRIENDPAGVAGAKRIRLSPAPAMENVRMETVGTSGNPTRKIKQFILTPQVPVSTFVVDVPVKRETAQ